MKIFRHDHTMHFVAGRYRLMLICRWKEARQLGLGFAAGPRTRWIFLTQWKFRALGW